MPLEIHENFFGISYETSKSRLRELFDAFGWPGTNGAAAALSTCRESELFGACETCRLQAFFLSRLVFRWVNKRLCNKRLRAVTGTCENQLVNQLRGGVGEAPPPSH